jgi:hypothetical protein
MKINEIISEDREQLDEVIPLVYGAMLAAPAVATAAARYSRPIINGIKTIGKKIAQSGFGQNPVVKATGHGSMKTLDVLGKPLPSVALLGGLDAYDAHAPAESKPDVDDGSDIPMIDIGPDRALQIKQNDEDHFNGIGKEGDAKGREIWSHHEKGNDPTIDPGYDWADAEKVYHIQQDKLASDLAQLKKQNEKNKTPDNRFLDKPSEYDIELKRLKAVKKRKARIIGRHGNLRHYNSGNKPKKS